MIVGGGISSAAGAWYSAGGLWAAATAGVIGGAVAFAVLLFWKWLALILAAPAKLYSKQEAKIASIPGQPESALNTRRAIFRMIDAYRKLEIVSNRTEESAWNALSQRLEEYKSAYALLPPVSRGFHERANNSLTYCVSRRDFDRLLSSMNHATDVMLHGECEIDLTISSPNPLVVINRSSRRDRFIILNMLLGNREDRTVSLFPVWHMYIDPGKIHIPFQADGEPLKEWEENRHEFPSPANPPLAMPLQLSPGSSATGYWCFFIGDKLESVNQLRDGRREVETVLEIHDLASGRRTKGERFNIEISFFHSLLSPLSSEDA